LVIVTLELYSVPTFIYINVHKFGDAEFVGVENAGVEIVEP